MEKIQVLLKKKTCVMIAAYILKTNPDQVKCITLELYFTFKLSAGEDAAFQFGFQVEFTFTSMQ